MDLIYLDNAATTPIFPEVVDAMHKTMNLHYGNPSSIHAAGRTAKAKVESARKYIAKILGALPQEIIFTSGGTEGDNTVLQCAVVCACYATIHAFQSLVVELLNHRLVSFLHLL